MKTLGELREEGGMLVEVFNVEIITWLHTYLMVQPYPKTAKVFETQQRPSCCRFLDVP